jgi:hypothetical protein
VYRHVFVIPRNKRYWRNFVPSATELWRIVGLAQRWYPDVAFELSEHPPRSQRYPRQSENDQIRRTLETMSLLDFGPQFEHHLEAPAADFDED